MIRKHLADRTEGLVFSGYQGHAIQPGYVQSLFKNAPKGITPQKFRGQEEVEMKMIRISHLEHDVFDD